MLAAKKINAKILNPGLMLALAVSASGMFSTAQAADPTDNWYGAAMASVVQRDPNLHVDTGAGAQFVLGIPLTPKLNLEANIFADREDITNGPSDISRLGVGADLSYSLPGTKAIHPFVLAGLGVQQDDFTDLVAGSGSTNSPFLDLGAGLTTPITSKIGFRGEVRAHAIQYDKFPGDNVAFDFRLNLGLSFGGQ